MERSIGVFQQCYTNRTNSNSKRKEITEDEKSFNIPEGWEWMRLEEILINHKGGGIPSKDVAEYWGGNIPWASVKDLNSKVLLKTVNSITEKGNLIICTRVGIGKFCMTLIDVAINQDLRGLYFFNDTVMKYYMNYYSTIELQTSGTTVKGISMPTLLNNVVSLPPLTEQKRIVKKLDTLMEMLDMIEFELTS